MTTYNQRFYVKFEVKMHMELPELKKHLQLALRKAYKAGVQDQLCTHPQHPLILI